MTYSSGPGTSRGLMHVQLGLFLVIVALVYSTCTPARCAFCPSYPCTASDACGECSCVKGPNELVGECMDISP